MKFLLWAVLILAVIWVLRNKQAPPPSRAQPRQPLSFPRRSPDAGGENETMLRCAHCGTHFPASEAVFDTAHNAFCSSEHRQRYTVH